ncbi:MAG: PhoH family protein [Alphaproteobacteria bacterium]|nr:PhoH family protein [Alphaproteobacteria bacterium SS10]
MAKRNSAKSQRQSAREAARETVRNHAKADGATVHALPGFDEPYREPGWDPLGDDRYGNNRDGGQGKAKGKGGEDRDRDQSYIRKVKPRSAGQAELMDAIKEHNLALALGPAGTGKTYLAIASAVEALENGEIDRIILSRPAIDAGENIGFLPGALEEKMHPYLRPLFDCLTDRLGNKRLRMLLQDGTIEIAPVGFMRGRTLNNAYVVIDEAQNCTYAQLKMLMTRLGWHSTMVITGDPEQSDLLEGMSGLADIAKRLETLPDIAVVQLNESDIVRHPLVASMLSVL